MGTIFTIIYTSYQKYFAAGGVNVLLLAALFWLYQRKKQERIMPIIWASIMLGGIIIFPATAAVIMRLVGADVYWRVFWMLPVMVILAYAGVELVWDQKKRGGKILLAAGCAAVIALNGTFVFSNNFFTARENIFKLPTAVVHVTNAVNDHVAEHHIRVRKKRVLAPTSMAVYMRLYDASIRQRYGRFTISHNTGNNVLYNEINSDTPNYEALCWISHSRGWRYIVLTDTNNDPAEMENFGYEQIYEGGGYHVYFDTHRYSYRERKERGFRKHWDKELEAQMKAKYSKDVEEQEMLDNAS